jgi:hypothetical protein
MVAGRMRSMRLPILREKTSTKCATSEIGDHIDATYT